MLPPDHARRTCASCGAELLYRANLEPDLLVIYSPFCLACETGYGRPDDPAFAAERVWGPPPVVVAPPIPALRPEPPVDLWARPGGRHRHAAAPDAPGTPGTPGDDHPFLFASDERASLVSVGPSGATDTFAFSVAGRVRTSRRDGAAARRRIPLPWYRGRHVA